MARRARLLHGSSAQGGSGQEPPASGTVKAEVVDLAARRVQRQILAALEQRTRYKYVKPRVVREGLGWKIVSPNCSRNIDPEGGEIDIAWLVPSAGGDWLLFARDHAQGCWLQRGQDPALEPLLALLCADPAREFWR